MNRVSSTMAVALMVLAAPQVAQPIVVPSFVAHRKNFECSPAQLFR